MMHGHSSANYSGSGLARRAVLLFANFFLIILAYYQVKSASRSLLVEYWGADRLPYVWIVSALVLGTFIGFYHQLVKRHRRLNVVLGSCLAFIAMLVTFRALFAVGASWAALGFYVFVDIFSVILVEQFWSLANTVNDSRAGKRSYWFVGTGGLVGGVAGGALAAVLIERTPLGTADLLLTCAAILGLVFALNQRMGRMGIYDELPASPERKVAAEGGWRALLASRYLLLIAAALLCAQLAQPLVEFQFLKIVEATYTELNARTAYLSWFFSLMGLVSIAVNLVMTPVVHRALGVMAGMLTQPLALAGFSFGFLAQPSLWVASAMKISDRGLSYSINRASKELLYIPVDPVATYQAKAWIDMLGYRLFKVVGSVLILLATQWLPWHLDVAQLSWLTLGVCAAWIGVIALLAREYQDFAPREAPA